MLIIAEVRCLRFASLLRWSPIISKPGDLNDLPGVWESDPRRLQPGRVVSAGANWL